MPVVRGAVPRPTAGVALFCPARPSRTWPVIGRVGRFAVNVLAENQREISAVFGARGADKFSSLGWTPRLSGSPLLDGALTWVECELRAVHEAGDHYVVVGKVTSLGEPSEDRPLLFYRGRYTGTEPLQGELGELLTWAGADDWL